MARVPAPQIIWRGAHPNNFTVGRPGGGRNGQETFHHVVGSAESAVIVFNNPNRGGSAHFIVTDQPGKIFQCVSLDNTAWADSNWQSNLRSVSVEHHGDWRGGYNNPVVRENAAHLCAWLRDQGIVTHAVRHRQVATNGTICPADLPVEAIWNRATDIIKDYNTPKPAPQPEWMKNRKPIAKTVYAQNDGLRIINLNDPSKFADTRVFARNTSFQIGSQTTVGGVTYYITKSSTDANISNGIRANEVAETPWAPPVVTPPQPTTPKWYDSVIDDENKTMYVLRATPLVALDKGKPYLDKNNKEVWYQAGDIIKDVSAHTIISGKTYQLTDYSFKKILGKEYGSANGIDGNDLSLNPQSTPPGTPANPDPDKAAILAFLEMLAKLITDFIAKFKK